MLAGYTQWERDSWNTQETESIAYLADNTADAPMIRAIAEARGCEVDVLATKVVQKSSALKVAVGAIMGKKQKDMG